jgi:hypothetical protein
MKPIKRQMRNNYKYDDMSLFAGLALVAHVFATINPLASAIRSDTISHLGNIIIRSGNSLKRDPENELIVNGTAEQEAMMSCSMQAPHVI